MKLRATQLDALLRNWDMYEKMIQEYADGTGSMAEEAEKTANSWEGSLNRLSNTWTDTVQNFVNSDFMIGAINALNDTLNIVNELTDKIGGMPILITAITAAVMKQKGGREKMFSLNEYAASNPLPIR